MPGSTAGCGQNGPQWYENHTLHPDGNLGSKIILDRI
jgi:hypothetical protein